MIILPPLSLYIHMPWCVRKCPYCDFNSHTLRNDLPEEQYIIKLLDDLEQDLSQVAERPLISIFIGGGTPSLFSAAAIQTLLNGIQQRIRFANNIEITLEANPGTVEYARFAGYRQAGVNRLSIGIQSFQTEKLIALGRIHDNQQAKQAANTAHQAGFENFNLDLMHGLPQQTIADALYDLQTAIDLHPTHLSWYQLTLEPNTAFYHHPPVLPQDDYIDDMQTQGRALLQQHHFMQYEISAYAKNQQTCQPFPLKRLWLPDKGAQFQDELGIARSRERVAVLSLDNPSSRKVQREPLQVCQHNVNYWQFGDYLGIGAGAHSKITDVKHHTITRAWKLKHPKDYLQATNFIGDRTTLSADDLPFEFMLNALRLYQPIPMKLFCERTGLNSAAIAPALQQGQQQGLLTCTADTIFPTELGRRFYNDLVAIFLNTKSHTP